MPDHEPWNDVRAREIIAAHVGMAGASLPILHHLQRVFGFIPQEAEPIVAAALNLSRAEVHGIVTFYHEFRREKPGRHRLLVCRAEACQAVGGEAVGDHIRKSLGVEWHGTTANGSLTVQPVFCLGLCSTGPAALLDGNPVGRLDARRIDSLLQALS